MEVIEYKHNVVGLSNIITEWYNTCNADDFGMSIDVKVFGRELQVLIDNDDCVLFALMYNYKVIGILGMNIFINPINGNRIANEHFWFVLKDYRGRSIRLMKRGFNWAKDNNCSHIMFNASMLASNLHDRVCKLYEKMGMKKIETSYLKEI